MKCPCHGCTDRTSTCHADCTKYAEWSKWNSERVMWLRNQKAYTSEGLKKRETEKLRHKARYGNGGKWRGGNSDG